MKRVVDFCVNSDQLLSIQHTEDGRVLVKWHPGSSVVDVGNIEVLSFLGEFFTKYGNEWAEPEVGR